MFNLRSPSGRLRFVAQGVRQLKRRALVCSVRGGGGVARKNKEEGAGSACVYKQATPLGFEHGRA